MQSKHAPRARLAADPAPQRPYTLTRETLNAMFNVENHAAYRARQLAVSRRPSKSKPHHRHKCSSLCGWCRLDRNRDALPPRRRAA